MSKTSVITTRLDAETVALVDKVAASQGRSRSWFVAEAVKRVAESEADFLAFIQAGIDAADCGELTPHDQVFADLRRRRRERAAR